MNKALNYATKKTPLRVEVRQNPRFMPVWPANCPDSKRCVQSPLIRAGMDA